jgi:DnaJ-class molecular chaperone
MSKERGDAYDILDLDRGASLDDIKAAYRKLSKLHHLDRGGSEETYKKINAAYELLKDGKGMGEPEQVFHRQGMRGFDGGWSGDQDVDDLVDAFKRAQANANKQAEGRVRHTRTRQRRSPGNVRHERRTCPQCQGSGMVDHYSFD